MERNAIESIFLNGPKRADIYWFIHVETLDEPYTTEYKVNVLAEDDVVKITFRLGFRVGPRINLFFRQVVEEMVKNREVDVTSRYESLHRKQITGDFKFIIFESYLSYNNDLPLYERIIMKAYFFLKKFSLSKSRWFRLESNNVLVEKMPLVIRPVENVNLVRSSQRTPASVEHH